MKRRRLIIEVFDHCATKLLLLFSVLLLCCGNLCDQCRRRLKQRCAKTFHSLWLGEQLKETVIFISKVLKDDNEDLFFFPHMTLFFPKVCVLRTQIYKKHIKEKTITTILKPDAK